MPHSQGRAPHRGRAGGGGFHILVWLQALIGGVGGRCHLLADGSESICWPAACQALPHAVEMQNRSAADGGWASLPFQPNGYDYNPPRCDPASLDPAEAECSSGALPCPPGAPPAPLVPVGCDEFGEHELDLQLLAVWVLLALYMFYAMAHVTEDFLVPALNLLCERKGIPEDVAGATLLAAGCNAPELFASLIGVFLQHSTVGAGTVVGSAPFNLLVICGGAAFAVKGEGALALSATSATALPTPTPTPTRNHHCRRHRLRPVVCF